MPCNLYWINYNLQSLSLLYDILLPSFFVIIPKSAWIVFASSRHFAPIFVFCFYPSWPYSWKIHWLVYNCMYMCGHAGAIYFHDCNDQDKIPIWLIVFGVVSLFHTSISLLKHCGKLLTKKSNQDSEDDGNRNASYVSRSGSTCESLLSLFLFIWVIVGSVWVFGYYYSTWAPNDCTNNPSVCNCSPVVFLFSYISLIVMYAISLLFCCCGCCWFCIVLICLGSSGTD